jgi:hypothetical protein
MSAWKEASMHVAMNPLTVTDAFQTLKAAGFPRPYVERLLPEWWDNSLFRTSAGVVQFAALIKQRLGLDVKFEPSGNLTIQTATPNARFKRRKGTLEGELHVAAHLGVALARLAVFSSKHPYSPLPSDPALLGAGVKAESGRNCVDFQGLLDNCWKHGIPVLFLRELPRNTKRMTGMAVNVSGRPAIVLGYNSKQTGKQLFVLAHELAHILCGHLRNNEILIDEELADVSEGLSGAATTKKDEEEKQADAFALALLRNGHAAPLRHLGRIDSATVLASSAYSLGEALGIDPTHLILSYAKDQDDWMRANQALSYIPDESAAIDMIRRAFLANTSKDALTKETWEYVMQLQAF